ncbi:MAG: hypothetical protein ACREQW_20810, partial [Candidatus Binatia bacterium]
PGGRPGTAPHARPRLLSWGGHTSATVYEILDQRMATIGVVVFCVAGMRHLGRCLKSIEWADDVAVVNLGEGRGFVHNLGSAERRQRTDWILQLWAEERIDKKLEEQLSCLRRIPLDEARPAYRIPIRSYLLANWVDGSIWGPSPSLRLTRGRRHWPPAWWNLDAWELEGSGCLTGCIQDYSAAELSSGIGHVNTVSSLWAQELNGRDRIPGLTKASLFSVLVLLRLLVRRTMLHDGFAGLTLSVLCAYATLLVGAKAWERRPASADSSTNRDRGRTSQVR